MSRRRRATVAVPADVHVGQRTFRRRAALHRETGGDVPTAVAGYDQGLGSVRRHGLFADTQRYVANVMALRGRTG